MPAEPADTGGRNLTQIPGDERKRPCKTASR